MPNGFVEGHVDFMVNMAPILALLPFEVGLVVRMAYGEIKFRVLMKKFVY